MKIYLDITARKSGDGAKRIVAELGEVEKTLRQQGHTVERVNLKWRQESEKTARAIEKNMRSIAVASGRATREQARALGGGAPSRRTGAGGSGQSPLAGVGMLGYLSRLPGGSVAGPIAGLTGMIPGVGRLAAAVGLVTAAVAGLSAAFSAAWRAGEQLLRLAVQLTIQGYEYNSMLEQSKLGVAALITSLTGIRDMYGQLVQGEDKWSAAMTISGGIQQRLRAEAVKTAATYEQLVRALQEAAGPAISKGFQPNEVVTFTTQVAQVAQAISLPFEQLNQEVRGFIEGDMSRNSRIARLLLADLAIEAKKSGTTVADELQKMAKAGTLFDFLSERMREFSKAAEAGANTYSVALSNLKDAFESAIGRATQDETGRITAKIKELTAAIVTFDEAGNMRYNEKFIDGLTKMATVVTNLLILLANLAMKFNVLYDQAVAFQKLSTNDQISAAARGAAKGVSAVMPWWTGAGLISRFSTGLDTAARFVRGEKDTPLQRQVGLNRQAEQTALNNQRIQWAFTGDALQKWGASFEIGKKKFSEQLAKISKFEMGENEFRTAIGRFRDENGPMKTVALLREVNKHTKDGALTTAELTDAMQNAQLAGYQFEKTIEDVGKKTKETRSSVASLLNPFEALTARAIGAADAMRELSVRGADMGRTMERDIALGRRQEAIRDLETGIEKIERDSGGNLTVADIEATEALRHRIVEQERSVALMRASFAAKDREAQITKLLADAEAKHTQILQLQVDLQQLIARRDRTKDAGNERASIEEQIRLTRMAVDAALGSWKEVQQQAAELTEQSATQFVQAQSTAAAEASKAHMAAAADAAGKRQDIEDKTTKAILKKERALLRELSSEWQRFGDVLGRSVRDAFDTIATGGSLKDALGSIADGVRDIIGSALSETVSSWYAQLQMVAAGKDPADATGATPLNDPRRQQRATNTIAGAQSAGAIYSILNQGGSKNRNIAGGAITGAITGFQVSGGNPVGAIVGALAGAILGMMASSVKNSGFDVQLYGGKLFVRPIGDTKGYQVEEAVRSINSAITESRQGMMSVLLSLPAWFLGQIGDIDLTPAIADASRNIQPTGSAGDAIRDFITVQVPKLVLEAYLPVIGATAGILGVAKQQIDNLKTHLRTLDFKGAQEFVSDFFGQLITLMQSAGLGAMNVVQRLQFAYDQANMRAPAKMLDLQNKITSFFPEDFAALPIAEQVALMKQLMPLIDERYQMELEYLAEMKTTFDALLKGIDDQIFEYDLLGTTGTEERSPQDQIDMLLQRGRDIKDQIRTSMSHAEIETLTREYQSLIDRIVQLGGNRPEDRANAIADLRDLRAIVHQRYGELVAEVATLGQPYFDLIARILEALRKGILEATGTPNGPDPTDDPDDPDAPVGDDENSGGVSRLGDASRNTAGSLERLREISDVIAERWRTQFGGTDEGGVSQLRGAPSATAEEGATVIPFNFSPTINVTVEGDGMEAVVNAVRAEIVNEATQRTITVQNKIARRRARWS